MKSNLVPLSKRTRKGQCRRHLALKGPQKKVTLMAHTELA
jgi:hypothetical protein